MPLSPVIHPTPIQQQQQHQQQQQQQQIPYIQHSQVLEGDETQKLELGDEKRLTVPITSINSPTLQKELNTNNNSEEIHTSPYLNIGRSSLFSEQINLEHDKKDSANPLRYKNTMTGISLKERTPKSNNGKKTRRSLLDKLKGALTFRKEQKSIKNDASVDTPLAGHKPHPLPLEMVVPSGNHKSADIGDLVREIEAKKLRKRLENMEELRKSEDHLKGYQQQEKQRKEKIRKENERNNLNKNTITTKSPQILSPKKDPNNSVQFQNIVNETTSNEKPHYNFEKMKKSDDVPVELNQHSQEKGGKIIKGKEKLEAKTSHKKKTPLSPPPKVELITEDEIIEPPHPIHQYGAHWENTHSEISDNETRSSTQRGVILAVEKMEIKSIELGEEFLKLIEKIVKMNREGSRPEQPTSQSRREDDSLREQRERLELMKLKEKLQIPLRESLVSEIESEKEKNSPPKHEEYVADVQRWQKQGMLNETPDGQKQKPSLPSSTPNHVQAPPSRDEEENDKESMVSPGIRKYMVVKPEGVTTNTTKREGESRIGWNQEKLIILFLIIFIVIFILFRGGKEAVQKCYPLETAQSFDTCHNKS